VPTNTQLAQIRGDVGASLANLVPPVPAPEAPTGLSSVAAAEAAKAVDTIHEQIQGADNGENLLTISRCMLAFGCFFVLSSEVSTAAVEGSGSFVA
jgi:tellurite resistance protein TehA-like permease